MVRPRSMKARRLLVASIAAAMVCTVAPARALDPVGDDIHGANNLAALSLVARHVSYDELNDGLAPGLPDVLDSESGWVFGFLAEAKLQQTLAGIPNVYLRPSFGYTWGTLTYDGRTQPTGPGGTGSVPVTASSGASIIDFGLDLGVGIPLGTSAALTPIVRVGQRRWKRDVGAEQFGSFRESYSHVELGGGVLLQIALARRVVLGASATLGRTFSPNVNVVSYPLDLGNALVVHAGASLDWALAFSATSPLRAFVAWDLVRFTYGKSDPYFVGGSSLTEPDSRTLQQDVRAGVAFAF